MDRTVLTNSTQIYSNYLPTFAVELFYINYIYKYSRHFIQNTLEKKSLTTVHNCVIHRDDAISKTDYDNIQLPPTL